MSETLLEKHVVVLTNKDCHGTIDTLRMEPGHLHVIDLKTGYGLVSPESEQLRAYALGAYLAYDNYFDFEEIQLTIVQPRDFANPIKHFFCTPKDLFEFEEELIEVIELSESENPPLNPTAKGCQYCKAAPTCGALIKQAQQMAREDWEEYTEIDLPEKLALVDVLEGFCKSVRKHAAEIALRGVPIEGFKLVEGKTNRTWDNKGKAASDLINEGYVPEEIYDMKLLSPAKIEKLVGKKHQVLTDHVIKPKGKPTLVSVTDRRKPFNVNDSAREDFA